MDIRRFENQHGIIEPHKLQVPMTIVGAGAIGSFFAMTFAKMGGTDIEVYDDDTIEDHNIANQIYPELFIGEKKVSALKSVVFQYAGIEIVPKEKKFEATDPIAEKQILVATVDNMDARKMIWDTVQKNLGNSKLRYFLDGRMGAEVMRLYCIDLRREKQRKFYESTLYSTDSAVKERCSVKSIIYTVLLCAGFMNNMLKRALNEDDQPENRVLELAGDCASPMLVPTRERDLKPTEEEIAQRPEPIAIAA